MIDGSLFKNEFFDSAKKTLDLATDKMITHNFEVYDFDDVKKNYCNKYNSSNEASKSVDTILINKQHDRIVFIECKSGSLIGRNSGKKKSDIKSKLRDSLLIFNDINSKNLDFSRDKAEFILLYDESENPSLGAIQKRLSQKAGEEFIKFDLGIMRGVFVKNVHTYTVDEFNKYLADNNVQWT
ncbi:hypothetical protein [Streptococcus massiliensis]|uniref:Uncharacterized protein n=1 Tax=Streptococcus massiliensis TaxID=313439 RepID=A0A380KY79_9STRE|nr:hypothetical protein [Streptococcus massiliensis]SUN76511.1 Uncharacterised protein [Streptococcus massiliensis]